MMKLIGRIIAMLFLAGTTFLVGCDDDDEPDPTDSSGKYVLEVRSTDGNTMALHPLADLTTGQAEIKDAYEGLFSWYVADWDGNGALFSADINPGKYTKYEVADKVAITQQLPLTDNYTPSANLKLDDERIWYVRNIDGETIYWDILNTTSMTIEDEGSFTLPVADGKELGAGFAMTNGINLIFGYRESDATTFVDEQVKIAVLDGSTYAVKNTDTDDRSCGTGNAYTQGAFQTENGDVYFPTLSFAYAGNNPDKPSGFMRVKKDATQIDDTYFLNVSEKVNGNNLTGPLVYLGNNKVVAQVVREDLVVGGDYWGVLSEVYQNEWYLIDLSAQTVTKLDVPLSRGNGDGNPIKTSDGLAAFVVNAADGNFIYTYNPTTGETKKGVTYIGANVIYKVHNIE
jgi:hypothetical protein